MAVLLSLPAGAAGLMLDLLEPSSLAAVAAVCQHLVVDTWHAHRLRRHALHRSAQGRAQRADSHLLARRDERLAGAVCERRGGPLQAHQAAALRAAGATGRVNRVLAVAEAHAGVCARGLPFLHSRHTRPRTRAWTRTRGTHTHGRASSHVHTCARAHMHMRGPTDTRTYAPGLALMHRRALMHTN